MIDLYLSPDYAHDWKAIVGLSKSDDEASRKKLTRYVMEACRIVSSAAGVSRIVAKDIVVTDGDKQVTLQAGQQLFVDLVYLSLRNSDSRILRTRSRVFSPNR